MSQPRLRKQHRTLAADLDGMGFDVGLTDKGHLRITHRTSKRTIFGSGTPSDFRAYRNLMAQVKRFLSGAGL